MTLAVAFYGGGQRVIMRRDNDLLAVAARAILLLLIVVVGFAALSPVSWMPRLLDSYHLEHFAAFYLLALAMAAARYRTSLYRVLLDSVILASLLGVGRAFIPVHALSALEDWVSEIGGALAALCPVMVGEFRRSFAPVEDAPVHEESRI